MSYAGRIDLGPRSAAAWRTVFVREDETRGSAGVNFLNGRPAELQRLESGGSVTTEFGRLGISAAAGVATRSYLPLRTGNGTVLSQSFRNTRTFRVSPRFSFRAPSATIFGGGSVSRTKSVERSQQLLRDTDGYTVLVGVRSDNDRLIVGEIGVGWRGQSYRDPSFRDFSGLTYDATVDWYPTRFVSMRMQLGQDIVNSGFARVAGIVRRSVGATLYYDPLRTLRFVAAVDQDRDKFGELGFSTSTTTASVTARHQLGRRVDVSVFGRFTSKSSTDTRFVEGYGSADAGLALTATL